MLPPWLQAPGPYQALLGDSSWNRPGLGRVKVLPIPAMSLTPHTCPSFQVALTLPAAQTMYRSPGEPGRLQGTGSGPVTLASLKDLGPEVLAKGKGAGQLAGGCTPKPL